MREKVAKIMLNAIKSCQNDVGCVKQLPKLYQMHEKVANMTSNEWKSSQTDVECVKK